MSYFVTWTVPPRDRRCQCHTLWHGLSHPEIDVVSVRLRNKDCPTQRSTLSVSDFVTRTVPPRDRRCQCQTLWHELSHPEIDVVSVRLCDTDCPTQRSTLSVSDFVTRTVPPRNRRCQCQTLWHGLSHPEIDVDGRLNTVVSLWVGATKLPDYQSSKREAPRVFFSPVFLKSHLNKSWSVSVTSWCWSLWFVITNTASP